MALVEGRYYSRQFREWRYPLTEPYPQKRNTVLPLEYSARIKRLKAV